MLIIKLEFARLEKELSSGSKSFRDFLAPEIGRVYVVSVTRDGCPACARQKPRLEKLAKTMREKHRNNVFFTEVHVKRPADSDEESLRSKGLLGHYFYPTNLILLRTKDRGSIEFYRCVSPTMSELGKKIEAAVEIASMMKKL